MTLSWWHPDRFLKNRDFLQKRMVVIRAIRRYFDHHDFWEVETPILQVCPVMDTHIHGIAADIKGVDLQFERRLYLHTSPEFAMKKLLVAGLPRIYQICHVFRNAEGSKRHVPEFTMIEWYRAQAGYREIMNDCVELLRSCARAANIDTYRYKNLSCDPFAAWKELSVVQAFREYAGLDLCAYLGEEKTDDFRQAVKNTGLHVAADDRWDDIFFRVMGEKIEPHLGNDVPVILKDYPVSQASLARPLPHDPRFAERFELYVCGIELANAFGELTDPKIQRARFNADMEAKKKIYGERYPLDEDFLKALEHGMPESGGIALGIDRLIMLICGVDDIECVLWAGRP